MAKMVKKSVVPLYLVSGLWLIWPFLFPLYRVGHFIAPILASAVVFIVGKALFPDKTYSFEETQGAKNEKAAPQAEEKKKEEKKSTGDPELDKIVEQKDLALAEMRRLNESIKDEKISAQIDHLEDTTGKIITHVVENPQKKSQITRFLNYYLPTTLKLLNAYDRMDAAGVSGANIDGTMGKIETMMDTVVAAFDRQLDSLFGDVAVDISTDITVMENLLSQEGLSGTTLGGL